MYNVIQLSVVLNEKLAFFNKQLLGYIVSLRKLKYFEVMLNIFEFSWVRENGES